MRYVDGYVLPVPRKNLGAYRRIARKVPFDCKRMVYGGFKVLVAV
jgi:uncharacterized protein YbaA (DUF1428 family)